jgi:GT2 family glycosyltransferase
MDDVWDRAIKAVLAAALPRRISCSATASMPQLSAWAEEHGAKLIDAEPLTTWADVAVATGTDWASFHGRVGAPIGPVVLMTDATAMADEIATHIGALGWGPTWLPDPGVIVLVPPETLQGLPLLRELLQATPTVSAPADNGHEPPSPSIGAPPPPPTPSPAPRAPQKRTTGASATISKTHAAQLAEAQDHIVDARRSEAPRAVKLENEVDRVAAFERQAVIAAEARAAELEHTRLEAANARGAAARALAQVEEVREALEAEIDELRGRHGATSEELARLRITVVKQQIALEQATTQRLRLLSAAAAARTDYEAAEAERSALAAQVQRLVTLLTASGVGHEPEEGGPAAAATDSSARVLPVPGPYDWPALPTCELDVQDTFAASYPEADEPDHLELSLPSPSDHRGILVGAEVPRVGPSVDVVICVHDALDDVRTCLWSLVHKTTLPFRLIVVNDGSTEPTTALLAAFAEAHPAVTLIHNAHPPHGYTIAVNLGVRASTADYVVLLNSDTVVTFGWLERIVERGEADPKIGILGPLSNAASHQSVPDLRDDIGWSTNRLPDWLTPDGMASIVQRTGLDVDARLPFINGFCFVIKRAVLDAVGEFDEENFASGYCEENDFSQRARDAGYALAVVDDAFVFHAKSRSFGVDGRRVLAKHNYQLFLEKHGREKIERLVASMEADTTLAPVREAVRAMLTSPEAFVAGLTRDGRRPLSIVFVLPGLGDGGSGGSHSIYQEVHGLRALGVPARIALWHKAMDRARAVYPDADDIFEPFTDALDLAVRTEDADVISATHNKSVAMVAAARELRDDFLPAYYVQDYEPFFTQADSADVDEAIASYTAIDGMLLFAKTHWLCNVVGDRHGLYVAKVEPSIDKAVYRPSSSPRTTGPLRVAAMIRPRTPRRQPYSTIQLLKRLRADYGAGVEVETFGCHAQELATVTQDPELTAGHRGLLGREAVAELLAGCDVFLDMSLYQAFGRTALEAMACGATAVLPRTGGAWEFAVDEHNALLVDTADRDGAYRALASLVGDRDRVERMRAAALQTAERYSILRAALSEYLVFEHAYQRHAAQLS